jgi:CheY-like chemotaxis protein
MSDSEQKVPVQDGILRMPSQDAEGATLGGQLHGRVLLVDDDPLIRKFISRYLVAAGYVVRVAFDGLDGIGKLRTGPIDIIISDLTMPRMTGFEFLDVVRKRFSHIPVIIISGIAAEEMPEGVAADAYCPKNEFISEQLLQTMADLTTKLPLRTAPPPIDNEPVQARWDGNGHYIIGCKDCLREFNVRRTAIIMRAENWTACVHCGKMVQFSVVEHLGSA